jgi:hypothetical protein
MWWAPIVSAFAALLGAAIGGGIALHVSARNRRYQLEDGTRVREHQLADSHREALRQAYGEVFTSWIRFTELAARYIPDSRRVDRLYQQREQLGKDVGMLVYQEADRMWREANEQARSVSDELHRIGTDTHAKVTMVLLLEDDATFRAMLEELIPLMGIGNDPDLSLLEQSVSTRRIQLEKLSEALRGHFAPSGPRVARLHQPQSRSLPSETTS